MNQNQEVILSFTKGLQNKDIQSISSSLAGDCEWYTGRHFGTMMGKIACLNHVKVIFSSFRHLNFVLKQAVASEKTSVLEYAFLPKERASGYLKPSDYSGVFIVEVDNGKVQSVRTYYEDRTSHPRRRETSLSKTRPSSIIRHIDYDPQTGLPT